MEGDNQGQEQRPPEESQISRLVRTSLTGTDNQTFDVARISFALVMTGWFASLLTFLVMQVLQFRSKGVIDGFPTGIATLFGTLAAVLPCASWAVNIKAEGTRRGDQ